MKKTLEKIEKGIIRIENGELIGLGYGNHNHIRLEQLDVLMETLGKCGIIEIIASTMSAIGSVQNYLSLYDDSDNKELRDFISDKVRPSLIDVDFFSLNTILKAFI